MEGGTGSFNIAWLKNGKPIIDDVDIRQHENGKVLIISNVKKEDAGMYQCLARTSDETEQSAAQIVLGCRYQFITIVKIAAINQD